MYIHEILTEEMSYADAVRVWTAAGIDPTTLPIGDLRAARNKLAKSHHPDDPNNLADSETIGLINAAYDVLKHGRQGASSSSASSSTYRRDEPVAPAPWAHAGYSGGAPNSSSINRNDYRDMNYIKKRMWELSDHSSEQWTIIGFDGFFLRGSVTVYGSAKIFAEMARAMVMWQTKGGNPYKCRAVLVHKRRSPEYLLIWADDRFYDPPIEVEVDSFNENPSNDSQFNNRLRTLLDKLDANEGRLPDQPSFDMRGSDGTKPTIDVGDYVYHAKYGGGWVINTNVRKGISRVNFDGDNRNVKTDTLRKAQR